MKNSMLFFLCVLIGKTIVFAQITYESSDYADIGSTFNHVRITDASGFDFEQTGANFSWNYSSLTTAPPIEQVYEDPNNSPYKTTWCLLHLYIPNCNSNFNAAFNLGLPTTETFTLGDYALNDLYIHLFKTNTEINQKMFGGEVTIDGSTIPGILEFDDPDKLLEFPMNFNDTFTDTNSIDVDLSPVGFDLQVQSTGTRTNHVEGWGSLQIPNHTFPNTLKVKSVSTQIANVTYQGETTVVPIDVTSFMWFDKDHGNPVLQVTGAYVDGVFTPTTVNYTYFEPMGVQDAALSESIIYPNPTTGMLSVKLQTGESIVDVQIYNSSGQLVGSKLNLSTLPNGIYQVAIKTNKRIISEKIVRK